jgi:hypothetical protein
MQAPTHILAGVIIRRTFEWKYFKGLGIVLTIITALLMHGIFDKLGKLTYHPNTIDFTDPFWLIYQVAMFLISLVMIYIYWGEYKLGIIFSLLPDVDWIVLHVSDLFHRELIFYKTPLMHDALNYIIDNTLPFLNSLPDYRAYPWACLIELLFFGLLFLIYKLMISRRRNIHF